MRKLVALVVLLLAMACGNVYSAQITLAWDPDNVPDFAGYKIYYGTSSRNYQWNIDVGNVTSYTLTIQEGMNYYAAATAYTTAGLESSFSNEVLFGLQVLIGRCLVNLGNVARIVSIDSKGNVISTKDIPYSSPWKPINVSVAPNGNTSILWDNGSVARVWYLDYNMNFSGYSDFSHSASWKPIYHSLNDDSSAVLAWDNLIGAVSVWFLTSQATLKSYATYTYTPGIWKILSYSTDLLGNGLATWDNQQGNFITWDTDANGSKINYDQYSYNKNSWSPANGVVNGDASRSYAWKNTAGTRIFIWSLTPDGTFYQNYLDLPLGNFINYDGR